MTLNPSSPDSSITKAPTHSAKKKSPPVKKTNFSFFGLDPVSADTVPDEALESAAYRKLMRLVILEAITIAVLSGVFLLATPFFMPVYQYYALNTKKEVLQLVPLTMPNMTNRAILSWATTSITEIMTIGFGDFESKLTQQKPRFTPEGWDAYTTAFVKQKIGETFKQNQLVLTTVPSNTPVIVAQGVNDRHVYQWRVQMPVIMTYATNNNVTRHEKAVIDLTIVRVKPEQNPSGIGIDTWLLKN